LISRKTVQLSVCISGQTSNLIPFIIEVTNMPTSAPAALTLTAAQKEDLLSIEVDTTKLLLINNTEVDPGLPVDGYSSGHYLMFVEGTQEQHVAFYKKMYGTATIPELEIKVHGLWIYQTPSAKFNKPENKVTVS
jgi:hypothetical protein